MEDQMPDTHKHSTEGALTDEQLSRLREYVESADEGQTFDPELDEQLYLADLVHVNPIINVGFAAESASIFVATIDRLSAPLSDGETDKEKGSLAAPRASEGQVDTEDPRVAERSASSMFGLRYNTADDDGRRLYFAQGKEFDLTGEFRAPGVGEWFINHAGLPNVATAHTGVQTGGEDVRRLILDPVDPDFTLRGFPQVITAKEHIDRTKFAYAEGLIEGERIATQKPAPLPVSDGGLAAEPNYITRPTLAEEAAELEKTAGLLDEKLPHLAHNLRSIAVNLDRYHGEFAANQSTHPVSDGVAVNLPREVVERCSRTDRPIGTPERNTLAEACRAALALPVRVQAEDGLAALTAPGRDKAVEKSEPSAPHPSARVRDTDKLIRWIKGGDDFVPLSIREAIRRLEACHSAMRANHAQGNPSDAAPKGNKPNPANTPTVSERGEADDG